MRREDPLSGEDGARIAGESGTQKRRSAVVDSEPIGRSAPRTFLPRGTDPVDDLTEAENIANQQNEDPEPIADAVAIERARTWTAERAFSSLCDLSVTLSSNLDLPSLAAQILGDAIEAAGAKRGILFLGGANEELTPMLARGIDGAEIDDVERISRTVLNEAAHGRPIVTPDASRDPRFLDAPSVQIQRIRALICLPMMLREQPVGVLYIDAPEAPAPFPNYTHRLLQGLASLAAVALENARLHGQMLLENARLRKRVGTLDAFGRILTVSPSMVTLLRRAALTAKADRPALILGESGTGKELLAHAMHEDSSRALHPFLAINCAALPHELVEDLFFGHVRGAFTGALRDAPGYFRQADKGTLFLDEIGELRADLQAKLLRVLQDGIIRPLGAQDEIHVDVRLIAATSRNLIEAIQAGAFREDLYYRISVVELALPPLRERPEDIPILVNHFLEKHHSRATALSATRVSPEAMVYLQSLPWRGNVRELENLILRLLVLGEEGVITEDLVRMHLSRVSTTATQPSLIITPGRKPLSYFEQQERQAMIDALRIAGNNKSAAARLLNMHRNTFLRKMKKYGIGT